PTVVAAARRAALRLAVSFMGRAGGLDGTGRALPGYASAGAVDQGQDVEDGDGGQDAPTHGHQAHALLDPERADPAPVLGALVEGHGAHRGTVSRRLPPPARPATRRAGRRACNDPSTEGSRAGGR